MQDHTLSRVACAHAFVIYSCVSLHGSASFIKAKSFKAVSHFFSQTEVIETIGSWDILWGPAVYVVTGSSTATNSVMVTRSRDDPTNILVTICGTVPTSIYSWIFHDLDTRAAVWPFNTQPTSSSESSLSSLSSPLTETSNISIISEHTHTLNDTHKHKHKHMRTHHNKKDSHLPHSAPIVEHDDSNNPSNNSLNTSLNITNENMREDKEHKDILLSSNSSLNFINENKREDKKHKDKLRSASNNTLNIENDNMREGQLFTNKLHNSASSFIHYSDSNVLMKAKQNSTNPTESLLRSSAPMICRRKTQAKRAIVEPESAVVFIPLEKTSPAQKKKKEKENSSIKVSRGILRALNVLLSIKSGEVTLFEFLNNLTKKEQNLNIVFTGHSLGGTLSHCIALYAKDNMDNWKHAQCNVSLNVIAFASFTPGNKPFTDYYHNRLRQDTVCFRNKFDLVSYIWDKTHIDTLAENFSRYLKPSIVLTGVVKRFVKLIRMNYSRLCPEQEYFEDVLPDSQRSYLIEAIVQHNFGYLHFFGLSDTISKSLQKNSPVCATAFTTPKGFKVSDLRLLKTESPGFVKLLKTAKSLRKSRKQMSQLVSGSKKENSLTKSKKKTKTKTKTKEQLHSGCIEDSFRKLYAHRNKCHSSSDYASDSDEDHDEMLEKLASSEADSQSDDP